MVITTIRYIKWYHKIVYLIELVHYLKYLNSKSNNADFITLRRYPEIWQPAPIEAASWREATVTLDLHGKNNSFNKAMTSLC